MMIVGAWARAFHGIPRSTGDIDFFVRRSPENAQRLVDVLQEFGFGSLAIRAADFLTPDRIIQLGIDPYLIDINHKQHQRRKLRRSLGRAGSG